MTKEPRLLQQVAGALIFLIGLVPAAKADKYAAQREQLMHEVSALVAATREETGLPALSPPVMAAMNSVPRHDFVPAGQRANAYKNRPLPIGYGQTISQPYIVALMTELMRVNPGEKVLEIGTGSGYQAAVLSRLVADVYPTPRTGDPAQPVKGGSPITAVLEGDGQRILLGRTPFLDTHVCQVAFGFEQLSDSPLEFAGRQARTLVPRQSGVSDSRQQVGNRITRHLLHQLAFVTPGSSPRRARILRQTRQRLKSR